MELSENLKLRLDTLSGDTNQDRLARGADAAVETGPNDEAESQMRKALGLLGESPRSRQEPERQDHSSRTAGFNGGLHRRRFVQDGDVPATFADVEDLQRDVGYAPKTPIETGIARFVAWYRDYYGEA